jgi:hypothetical protein
MFSTNSDTASEQHQCRILCYGDSLTAGTSDSIFDVYPYAPWLERRLNAIANQDHRTSYVVRHRGLPGWTADAMLDAANDGPYGLVSAVRAVQDPAVRCVVLLAGTNDLGMAMGHPPEERAETILTPLLALHEMVWKEGVPKTIAVAIPPSGYQAQVSEASMLARQVNAELKRFCEEKSNGRAMFVEFPFEFERGGENWSVDTLQNQC